MLSISKFMDEYDVAQEVRFERQVHKGTIILLEGATDVKRFVEFLDDAECSIANCYGRGKASKAIELLSDDGFSGVLAILDCDFDRILKRLPSHENLIYSDLHDYDLEWATSDAFRRYLFQVGDPIKCEAHGGYAGVLQKILQDIKPLSILRLLNANGNIRYKLSLLNLEDFYDGASIDLRKLIEAVFEDYSVSDAQKDSLEKMIVTLLPRNYDIYQISNGHDTMSAIGIALRETIGSRAKAQTWGSEIELHLRLTFSDGDFLKTSVYREIVKWERVNNPYRVLHNRLRPQIG